MYSICSSSFRIMLPQWRHTSNKNNLLYWILPPSKRKLSFTHICSPVSSSFNHDSTSPPKQSQVGYDPSEDLFLSVDPQPRKLISDASRTRSWFGPNGQYIRELPCPSCRGRGYTPCAECGIERSRSDCSQCSGKGIITCQQCNGECVIWEESIDEQPWEKARSISPLKVEEDDEVDNLDIKLDPRSKTKRVYQSPSPEVNLKISRSLKSLNAKTGQISKRMKIIHGDPMLHAQRVAAIKKTKGSAVARKHASEAMKNYFSDPENRLKRSIAMKGAKFYCRNCGREGHRRHYCPEIHDLTDRRFSCRLCGQKGHNRRTCPRSKSNITKSKVQRNHHCSICRQTGHNSRTCRQQAELETPVASMSKASITSMKRTCTCSLCQEKGHNRRTCPRSESYITKSKVLRNRHCSICRQTGHNSRTCRQQAELETPVASMSKASITSMKRTCTCSLCLEKGHNRRTCPRSESYITKSKVLRNRHCSICRQTGHNSRTCRQQAELETPVASMSKDSITSMKRSCTCSLCQEKGHNRRTCPRSESYITKSKVLRNRHCSICRQTGHNSRTCRQQPELETPVASASKASITSMKRTCTCSLCLEKGHNRRTCPRSESSITKSKVLRNRHCSICRQTGHNSRTCRQQAELETPVASASKASITSMKRTCTCSLCQGKGHNRRTCPRSKSNITKSKVLRNHHCSICSQTGHNSRTCRQQPELETPVASTSNASITSMKRTCTCSLCQENGHNIRTCPQRTGPF